MERAGQGADRIYEESIKQSKPLPDFSKTDEYQVSISLKGTVQDENFLRFFEKIGNENLSTFCLEDFLVLDCVHKEIAIPEKIIDRKNSLLEMGIIERVGRGKGAKYFLCSKYYRMIGKGGVYTRKRGLDKATNKALLFRHINDNANSGVKLNELCQVLPSHSSKQIQRLVKELSIEGLVFYKGNKSSAHWFPSMIKDSQPSQTLVQT